MSDRRRTGDGEYIAQRRWERLADLVVLIVQRMRLLMEAMRTQSRVCPPALPRHRMRVDESAQEPRTSRGEPSGLPRAASADLLEDTISSCANRILVILANAKTVGDFVRRTEHQDLCYRVLRGNLQVRLCREKESLYRRSELASREISWGSYRLSAKFGLTVFGPRHLDSCASYR